MARGARIRACGGAALLALLLAPGRTAAQPSRLSGGLGLGIAAPLGEFADFIDVGYGIAGSLLWSFERSGTLALRVDGGALTYGRERDRVPLSRTVGRVAVDVTTSNNIAMLAVGPQIQAIAGPLRPYVNALAGLSYFFTESSVEGSGDFFPFARSTNYSDFTPAFAAGGGFYIPLGRRLALDLGAQYRTHGTTRYLTEGSIEEDGEGNVLFTPIESRTDLLVFRAGVAFGAW